MENDITHALKLAVRENNYEAVCNIVEKLLNCQNTQLYIKDLNIQCFNAIIWGFNDIVRKLFDLIHFNIQTDARCLSYACQYENFEMIDFFFKFMDASVVLYLSEILNFACRGGNMEIIDLVISKGASFGFGAGIINFNGALIGACLNGSRAVVDKIVALGASDFNGALWAVCRKKSSHHLLPFLIEKGANDWANALAGACYGGYLDLAKEILKKCLNRDLDDALVFACTYPGHPGFDSDDGLDSNDGLDSDERYHILRLLCSLKRYRKDDLEECMRRLHGKCNYKFEPSLKHKMTRILVQAGAPIKKSLIDFDTMLYLWNRRILRMSSSHIIQRQSFCNHMYKCVEQFTYKDVVIFTCAFIAI